ncbi:hypothetical protein CY34DRAFT_474328 [Suillus luteus UH-Slu-Lm8-n1]|uniref:Uncharacterized protein n=1 Tax=Suillus luteus UH-Slu-Lm8-n1 TaxID=930992 RepID=A0A0D0AG98_9AGAM|nr:hypothetical protein CY34DRAFT_474328 [Suillus luteus UH-Slu-Lm8-n1]
MMANNSESRVQVIPVGPFASWYPCSDWPRHCANSKSCTLHSPICTKVAHDFLIWPNRLRRYLTRRADYAINSPSAE